MHPVTSDEYKTAARRPRNSVLANDKLAATFGIMLPSWQDALRMALE